MRTRPYLVALLIGLAAQVLFTVHLDQPSKVMFDEIHYVPAARTLLDLGGPQNIEHPLVGKELIAAGIALLGDNPVGWRITATVAGTTTVLGIFALLWLLTGTIRPALIAAALVMINQLLFVQARTAMLDVYLGAFIVWAIVLMLCSMKASTPGQAWRHWLGASAMMGLAIGVKWAAIPYVALAGVAFLVLRVRDTRRAKRPILGALSGSNQLHWPGLPAISALLVLGLVSVTVYLATFAPAFSYAIKPLDLAELIRLQARMYALQIQEVSHHTYQSPWWSWPLMIRPIWFFYECDAGAQRGVLQIGNPVIMWGGFAAVIACLRAWFRDKAVRPLAMALLWIASVAIYAVIPKSIGFYYYYHLSGLFICCALAMAFQHYGHGRHRALEVWFTALALVAFVYFYPIIAASPLPNSDGYEHWMWLPSWR